VDYTQTFVRSKKMHELSYPALKGASGAPVFLEHGLAVVGVIVANHERELMPAQILRAVGEDGALIEEARYFRLSCRFRGSPEGPLSATRRIPSTFLASLKSETTDRKTACAQQDYGSGCLVSSLQ
jgi:hypothetical protein